MANQCLPSISACAIRVTRLDIDGVPKPGANNLYQTHGIIELTATPEVDEGEEVTVKNGQGNICINYKAEDQLKRANIELSICSPDPQLTELLAGGTVLTDGAAVGYQAPRLGTAIQRNGVSIELWSKQVDEHGDLDVDFPYWWWVFPKVKSIRQGPRRFFNGALENPFQGFAIENERWHNGPANDWPASSLSWFQYLPTDYLPADHCGYQTLVAS